MALLSKSVNFYVETKLYNLCELITKNIVLY